MKQNYKKITVTKTLALLLAFVIGFTLIPLWSGVTGSTASAASAKELDYIGDKYGLSDHVFDILTIDRLNLLLVQSKPSEKSVIVFADDRSATAKSAIPAINEKAKSLGIEKIYYFDLILAGENGLNIWDNTEETWPNTTTTDDVPVSQAFTIINRIYNEYTALKAVPDSFTAADDVFLFVLEGSAASQENNSEIAA